VGFLRERRAASRADAGGGAATGGLNESPAARDALLREQERLGRASPPPWRPGENAGVGGCFVCFARGISGPGAAGDPAWAGAALLDDDGTTTVVHAAVAGAPYEPGLLALREAALLEAAVRALPRSPDVLLVNSTGRDHPRRAGLALHLGSMLELPTIGVTHRPLLATGDWPEDRRGAASPLRIDDEIVGCWLRTRRGRRPLAISPGWRTDLETSVEVVLRMTGRTRTPEPLRAARRACRIARSTAARS
jgi:deoxyribonuclease V